MLLLDLPLQLIFQFVVFYDYLQHAIKIIKEIGCDYVTLAIVDEDMPLIIGREIDDDNKLSGLIMAPRVKDED